LKLPQTGVSLLLGESRHCGFVRRSNGALPLIGTKKRSLASGLNRLPVTEHVSVLAKTHASHSGKSLPSNASWTLFIFWGAVLYRTGNRQEVKIAARVAVNLESVASHGCLIELLNVRRAYSTLIAMIKTPCHLNDKFDVIPPTS
jgi:hypothetical protein